MNLNILVLNMLLYGGTCFLYLLGKQDSGNSLGFAFLMLTFWALNFVVVIFLLATKKIKP